jgi:hypothetical protein
MIYLIRDICKFPYRLAQDEENLIRRENSGTTEESEQEENDD